ncbi:MAG TPA: nuclear transport factor 2 family protein [Actinobacteria bacterium]|nr:nuclear transport factor 2 family protein [Actinomycetota bacterium]
MMPDASDFTELAERYIAAWNEPDPAARRKAVTEIWSASARSCTSGAEYNGHAAIETRVAEAHDKWVGQGGYLFRSRRAAEGHHGGVRIHWEMVPAAGGAAASAGVQFLILDDEDQVRYDYQFIDK